MNAVERAKVDPAEIEDVIMGAALQQGSSGGNVGRQVALRAGLPTSVPGMSIDRQCASGMMAIATAAKQVIEDGMQVTVGGGLESISLVQNKHRNLYRSQDKWLNEHVPAVYMSMLETAEIVAERYGVSRESQDEFAFQSQQRTAIAQQAGKFDDEIVALTSTMLVQDKETREISQREVTLEKDEGNRPSTTMDGLSALQPVFKDGNGRRGRQAHYCRQCLATFRWRLGCGGHGGKGSRATWSAPARNLSRHGRRRLLAG